MIPSDGGGSGAYTSWDAYDIETLHSMVDSATDDQIATSWQQVMAWQKTKELLDDHAATLDMYRQDLVEHWSPEKNAASAAFVKYVDDLIQSLRQSSIAASDNVKALSQLTLAVETARTEVKKAYQEYAANQTKIQAAAAKPASSSTPTPSPSPSPSPAPPPVAPGRQEQLTQQARNAMATLAGTAVDSTWAMSVPPPYTPPKSQQFEQSRHISDPSVVTAEPPVVPAPRRSASQFSATAPQVPGGTGSTIASGGTNAGPLLGGSAPILAGNVIAPPALGITPTPAGAVPVPNPPTGGLPLGVPMPFAPGLGTVGSGVEPLGSSGSIGLPFKGPSGRIPTGSMANETVPPRGVGVGRALPPGGVIGEAPGAGAVDPMIGGGRGSAGAGPRVNPVGGVLGQGGAPTGRAGATAGSRGTSSGAATGQPLLSGQRAGKSVRDANAGGWDPDDPWAVEHGVAPVLEPGREPSVHNPGPGVIGIDR